MIPHYDNDEGGTHDTRYCCMDVRRLPTLDAQLADNTAILGVDEHTAALLDLASASSRASPGEPVDGPPSSTP